MTVAKLMLGMAAAIALAAPVAAQAPTLAMLDRLEKGQWRLTSTSGPPALICLGDARQFIQLRHARTGCARYVIDDGPGEVTVHYTCPGAGHGRTTIRRETVRLIQVDTQGIAAGAPFSQSFEGRRVGPCP